MAKCKAKLGLLPTNYASAPDLNGMKVLFVDDEPKVLRAIERSLVDINGNWTMHFSTTAADAWQIIENESIDVIVSDMRMPDVDGAEFLTAVRDRSPDIARLILSGYKDEDASIRSTAAAHRFLAKPITGETLTRQIVEAGLSRDDEFFRNVVNSITCLPTPVDIHDELILLIDQPVVSVDDVAALVMVDPALAAKVLQLGNSAFFGAQAVIPSITGCLEKIGPEVLRHLMTTSQFIQSVRTGDGQHDDLVTRIQQHGQDSREQERQNVNGGDEVAQLGALLHVTGDLTYAYYGVDMSVGSSCCADNQRDITVSLLTLWGVPGEIIEAARNYTCG